MSLPGRVTSQAGGLLVAEQVTIVGDRFPGKVMKRKKFLILLVCVTTFVFALACVSGTLSKPSIAMGLLEYNGKDNDFGLLCAVVGLTNNGSITVRYDHMYPDEPLVLRTESPTGWVSKTFTSFEKMTISPSFLAPGSNTALYVYLPEGTLRWQIKYVIRRASIQGRIGDEFTGDWGNRLYSLSGNLGLTNEGSPQVFWSDVYELTSGGKLNTP